MDLDKVLDEKLREAACVGDLGAIQVLLEKGVNINEQHSINGWTALHWASRRKHKAVVAYLLSNGADKNIQSHSGETPVMVTDDNEIRLLIDSSSGSSLKFSGQASLPMQPHYLVQQGIGYTVDVGPRSNMSINPSLQNGHLYPEINDELVLKIRQGGIADKDFIEIELLRSELTYINLLKICASELELDPRRIGRIRKLPNTILRKDKDVMRLTNFQELEVFLGQTFSPGSTFGSNSSSTAFIPM